MLTRSFSTKLKEFFFFRKESVPKSVSPFIENIQNTESIREKAQIDKHSLRKGSGADTFFKEYPAYLRYLHKRGSSPESKDRTITSLTAEDLNERFEKFYRMAFVWFDPVLSAADTKKKSLAESELQVNEPIQDTGLSLEKTQNNEHPRKKRHRIKYKGDLSKKDRRLIKKGILEELKDLVAQLNSQYAGSKQGKKGMETDEVADLCRDLDKKVDEAHIELEDIKPLVHKGILCSKRLLEEKHEDEENEKKILNEEISAIGKAIASFERPGAKFVRLPSNLLAVLVGIVAGLSTATAAALALLELMGGGAVIAITLSGLGVGGSILVFAVFFAGFLANVWFFNAELPPIFLKAFGFRSSMFEFIDAKGNRKSLSMRTKVLLCIFGVMSLCVGLSGGAGTYNFFVLSAVACPPVVGLILGAIMCLGLSLIIFSAFTGMAPELSWNMFKEAVGKLLRNAANVFKNLTVKKICQGVLVVVLAGLALTALVFGCYIAGITLFTLFRESVAALVAAVVICSFSGVAQLPFTFLAIKRFLSLPVIWDEIKGQGFWGACKKIGGLLLIAFNATANAVLVKVNPPRIGPAIPSSVFLTATAGAGLNSFAGNLVTDNTSADIIDDRKKANEALYDELKLVKEVVKKLLIATDTAPSLRTVSPPILIPGRSVFFNSARASEKDSLSASLAGEAKANMEVEREWEGLQFSPRSSSF